MKSRIIWHYTSMDSFLQILRNRTLRFSQATRLNDSQEIIWIGEILKKSFDKEGCGTITQEMKGLLDEFINPFEFNDRTSPFIACFSEVPDQLSQWRAYGDDGRGIAIGFSLDWLLKNLSEKYINNGYVILFDNVKYFDDNVYPEDVYNEAKKIRNNANSRYKFADDNKPINPMARYFFKNNAFCEEKEYRMCYDPRFIVDKPLKKENRLSVNKLIIPYYDLIIDNGIKLPIEKVVLGPKNPNNLDIIKRILWENDNLLLDISKSKASYR